MSKKIIFTIILLGASGAMFIFKAETEYQNFEGTDKWSQAFGHAFLPWIVGVVVGLLKFGWSKMRKSDTSFGADVLWGAGIVLIIMAISIAFSSANAQDKAANNMSAAERNQLRSDALGVLGAFLEITDRAKCCYESIEPNKEIRMAAKSWYQRHKADIKIAKDTLVIVGLPNVLYKAVTDLRKLVVEKEFAEVPNQAAHCKELTAM